MSVTSTVTYFAKEKNIEKIYIRWVLPNIFKECKIKNCSFISLSDNGKIQALSLRIVNWVSCHFDSAVGKL